jgi:carboxypeptidase C (cathepsin A)
MGYFQVDANGTYVNEHAWNNVASMLYLESPAGSGGTSGFSECHIADKPVDCFWNDTSQAEAYAHSLTTFFEAFPEYKANDFYLTGESYAGQYVPNIAHYILKNEPFTTGINLKGFAIGNACWGGNATKVNCNGPCVLASVHILC